MVADSVAELARAGPPRLGSCRLVCIDGPAGSGKTTLATAVAATVGASVVHMDDLYPGWAGLEDVVPAVVDLLAALASGSPGTYRRYDWHLEAYAESVTVEPTAYLVLEGVNAGNRAWARHCTTLVWVQADPDTRLARGLARDGEGLRSRWEKWMRDEAVVLARESTRERADLEVAT